MRILKRSDIYPNCIGQIDFEIDKGEGGTGANRVQTNKRQQHVC